MYSDKNAKEKTEINIRKLPALGYLIVGILVIIGIAQGTPLIGFITSSIISIIAGVGIIRVYNKTEGPRHLM